MRRAFPSMHLLTMSSLSERPRALARLTPAAPGRPFVAAGRDPFRQEPLDEQRPDP